MDADQIFSPRFDIDTPYLADYFGLWMIHDQPFRAMVNQINGTNLHVHMQSTEIRQDVSSRDRSEYEVTSDGIAMFHARGPMMKAVPSMSGGSSTVRLRQQISAARRDSEVRAGMLVMDTPGGTSRGNEDLATEVAKFAAAKQMVAFVEDKTASAGVSIASQATKIYANNSTASYGAMGTYGVIEDLSGMAESIGVKVHVIKAGDFKGMGEPGTEVTEQQLAELQRIVSRVNENYLNLIASGLGRSVDSIRGLADGRVILASDAVAAGLINGVQSFEQTRQELREAVSSRTQFSATQRSNPPMADDKIPATLKELKSTFPNSTAEWRESQLEAENDISQSAIDYAQHVEKQAADEREKHQKELEEAKSSVKPVQASSSLGHRPLTKETLNENDILSSGDPLMDFESAVRQRLPNNRMASFGERQAAIAYVARTNPGLHRAYVETTNADKGKKVQRMVEEKYEEPSAA